MAAPLNMSMATRRVSPSTGRKSVVLVEDDLETREMYSAWLEHVGFDVFPSDNAETGFRQALEHQPRVVVTDYVLRNGPSGASLCRRLKADPRTEHIHTLLMTGSGERRTADGALDAGCAVVRLKPYLPDAMLADIDALIRGEQITAFPSEHER